MCFHHAVRSAHADLAASVAQLRDLTGPGNYAYYVDIAHFMGSLPLDAPSQAQWIDGEQQTRRRWRELVIARREYVRTPG